MEKDRIEMNRRERDVLKVMAQVLKGQRTQAEAARLLRKSVRQVRRIQRRMEDQGDGGVVHALRGRPSNRRIDPAVRVAALAIYRRELSGFGPTLAAEKLAERQVVVSPRALHLWLVQEGLWHKGRRGRRHRSRRERRACLGEMVQADASDHDWLEGRGPRLVLVGIIDDATSRVLLRFYPAETTAAYMDLLWRWLEKHGRPLAWYSDRDSVFHAQLKRSGEEPVSVPTQFSRALDELDIELILANSPQAKGRVERLWGTAQDRLVKELRLTKASTMEQANAVLEEKFMPWFNRRCVVQASGEADAHRPLGKGYDLAAILSVQEKRRVANDYTIRLDNAVYQLLPPAWPGQRGGEVIVEKRLDGSMKVRFKGRYLAYRKIELQGLAAPDEKELSLSLKPIPAECLQRGKVVTETNDRIASRAARSSAVHRATGRSGRTPAEPYPSGGKSCGRSKQAWRPAQDHPWRNGGPAKADVSTCAK